MNLYLFTINSVGICIFISQQLSGGHMKNVQDTSINSIRELVAEEMMLIAGGTGPGQTGPAQGGVWDGGTGDGGCIPVPNSGAD
jgi:hypothetical protein